MQILPGLGSPRTPDPVPVAIPPTREDPAIVEAKKKLRMSEQNRRGRASTIIAPSEGKLGAASVTRPSATKLG